MIRDCSTIQEFNEACTEYFKYHCSRFTCSEKELWVSDLITGISFKIVSVEQFKDKEVRSLFRSNVSILDDSIELLGKRCVCDGDIEGTFVGIEATEEDFYYMLKKDDGRIAYGSCVGYIFLKDK